MGLFKKDKPKGQKIVDASESVDAEPIVYFGGQEIGRIIRVKGKEIGGREHMEIVIRLDVGAGIDTQFQQVLARQGIHIGSPYDT